MTDIDWRGKILQEIVGALRYFQSQGVRPTLRTLYYNLVSKNLIPNTKATYKTLSRVVVAARKDGVVAWDALEDSARNVYGNFADSRFEEDIVEKNEEALARKLESFNAESILNEFFDYTIDRAYVSRWADQPTIAELWIEKEALAKTIAAWTENLPVKVRVNKGYSSWTFIYENCREMKGYLEKHDQIKVFYLGDLDPSGVDMERFLKEALDYFELDASKVKLRRLSVTDDHVEKYNLPPKPEDAETLAKLRRDPRSKSYRGKFIVELDAMVAFAPEDFRGIITDAVKSVWDRDLYNRLRAEAEEKNAAIQKLLDETKEKAKALLRDL